MARKNGKGNIRKEEKDKMEERELGSKNGGKQVRWKTRKAKKRGKNISKEERKREYLERMMEERELGRMDESGWDGRPGEEMRKEY